MDWVNTPLGPTKKNLKSLGGIWAEQYSVEILVESTPPRQLSSILEPVRNRVKQKNLNNSAISHRNGLKFGMMTQ